MYQVVRNLLLYVSNLKSETTKIKYGAAQCKRSASSCTAAARQARQSTGRSLDERTRRTRSTLYVLEVPSACFEHELTTFRYEEVGNKWLPNTAKPGASRVASRWAEKCIHYPYNLVQIVHVPDTSGCILWYRFSFSFRFLVTWSARCTCRGLRPVTTESPAGTKILWANFYEGHQSGSLTDFRLKFVTGV